MKKNKALLEYPSKLFVEVTTRCNFLCEMCIKQSRGSGIVDGDMSDEIFSLLVPAFSKLEGIVLNGIGEPLLHPHFERFIETAKRRMPKKGRIGFQTNGHLVDEKRAEDIVDAGADVICVSSDAVTPEIFKRMRSGGERETVDKAIDLFRSASLRLKRKVRIGVEFVLVRENASELPLFVQWAAAQRVDFVIVTHMLPYQENLTSNVAYSINSDRALELFHKWKAIALSEGVKIERYFEVFMKFHKNADDERIMDLVKKMTDDAAEQGVIINLDRLLNHDDLMQGLVSESFARASEIARNRNIDLQLPEIIPTRVRRCDFIEEGGAFVSWDGNIHPCYFLWHRYQCHVGGLKKYVRPEAFANVRDNDILSIWNSGKFRAFREGVQKYDFPFCYDCNVALCDYVQFEEFTQDCHLSSVPCAACLWCTGIFRCLQ